MDVNLLIGHGCLLFLAPVATVHQVNGIAFKVQFYNILFPVAEKSNVLLCSLWHELSVASPSRYNSTM